MRKRGVLLLVLCLLLSGCGHRQESSGFLIYYKTTGEYTQAALEGVPGVESSDWSVIFQQLSAAPEDVELRSVIPRGTELNSAEVVDGILQLDLSGEYSTLSGIEQTIANSCITLTYCQLKGISGVEITADGESMSAQGVLTEESILTNGGEGDTGLLECRLYFPLEESTTEVGYLVESLTIHEGCTPAETVLQGMCDGPVSKQLQRFLPENMDGITLWTEDRCCYVNLTADWVEALETGEIPLQLSLQCITNSICELESISTVQFLMDGAVLERWSQVGGDLPLEPNKENCVKVDLE